MSVDVRARAVARPAPTPPLVARHRGVLSLPVAVIVAFASGLVYTLGFPAANVWILAFVGVAGCLVALRGRGAWSGALVGLAFGVAYWFTLIDWLTLFLGPVPLLALGALESLIVAAGGMLVAIAYRALRRLWDTPWGRLGVTPLVVAAAWTTREAVASTWPYAGFGWGRFALSQSTSPFAPLAAWFGVGALGFVLAWLTAFAVAVALEPRSGPVTVPLVARPVGDRVASVLPRIAAVAVAAGLLLAIPSFPITVTGSFRVAAVQPNTHAGYFDPRFDRTRNLQQVVRATAPAVGADADLVVWPEGATMYDPFADAGVRQQLDAVTEAVGAPLLTGAITERDGLEYNSSLVWQGGGITGLYDKVRPVPFAEYVPDRAFWTPFAPDLLKLIGRDYTPGTRSPVLDVGAAKVGVDICFDIVDDGLLLSSAADGAQVLIAQTNNADFGTTEENEQQLAIARLRAIETGRALVSTSTVASTTAIGPDGRTIAAAKPFTAQTVIADVPLASGRPPAVAFGIGLMAAIALLGGILPVIAAVQARPLRPRRRRR